MTPPPSLQELIEIVQQDSPTDDLLDMLVTASSTVAQLEDVNDALLGHFVDRCRHAGRSWSEISGALGVSKQAVHKRFSGALADRIADRIITSGAPPTLERFTPRARNTLSAATQAARSLGHTRVGAAHLLLGLFEEPEGLAARALSAMNVGRDAVEGALRAASPEGSQRQGVANSADDPGGAGGANSAGGAGAASGAGSARGADGAGGTGDSAVPSRLPFAPDAAAALRDAVAEALELAHNYIGTEHLLLGLYRDPDNQAAKILYSLGAERAEAKVHIDEMLRGFKPGA
jgi:ATP-dependent Clp protease ATP-binding subunit ClpA